MLKLKKLDKIGRTGVICLSIFLYLISLSLPNYSQYFAEKKKEMSVAFSSARERVQIATSLYTSPAETLSHASVTIVHVADPYFLRMVENSALIISLAGELQKSIQPHNVTHHVAPWHPSIPIALRQLLI